MDAHQLKMALRDVDYPAGKEELIRAAEAAGAPGKVIRALRAIPPEVYRKPAGSGAVDPGRPGRGTRGHSRTAGRAGPRETPSRVHLRLCLTCGHVGCCDSSPLRHARAHAYTIGHPIVQSFEPGEDWRWCYVDETYV
jgi:Protein of unknown function (DUF2795)/Zn-finger in ubiquitin-hydrolases and other protein